MLVPSSAVFQECSLGGGGADSLPREPPKTFCWMRFALWQMER